MAATFTVTGTSGAGLTVTAVVFNNVSSFDFNTVSNILSMTDSSGHITQVFVGSATTFTWVKSGNNYVITVA